MKEIDVEKIMMEIRAEIKEKGYKETDLTFKSIPIRNCPIILDYKYEEKKIKSYFDSLLCCELNYYKTFPNKGIKGIFKRIIRKIIKPVVFPLMNRQKQFNTETLKILNMLNLKIVEQQRQIEYLEKTLR